MMPKPSVKATKPWVAKPLVTSCGVCGNPADSVKHYGGVACYSCRAFFRRATLNQKRSPPCTRKTNSCYVDSDNRNSCKKCRYEKCLMVGMKPEQVDRVKKKHLNIQTKCIAQNEIEECVIKERLENEETIKEQNIASLLPSPSFELTYEEEFKIYELLVRKENLMDILFRQFSNIPGFVEAFEQNLFSSNCGDFKVKADFIKILEKKHVYIDSNLTNGGTIKKSLDMFDEFKNVSERVKTEALRFSMSVFRVCNRALIKGNVDKEYFVDQHIAAGVYNNTLKEMYETKFPNNRYAVKSVDPFSLGRQFNSPWAERHEDEVFFLVTLESVGNIVKDDVHLGALYSTLILATPGARLADYTKNDPALQKVQDELSVLIYRYLKNKYNNSTLASTTTNNLLKLLGDLHTCRDIFAFNRLPYSFESDSEDSLDLIEISKADFTLN